MAAIVDTEMKSTSDHDIDLAYLRFDRHSTYSTCSTVVVSSCSDDEERKKNNSTPPIKWKRQNIINKNRHDTLSERPSTGSNDAPNSLHIDRNLAMSAKENVAYTIDEELRSMPPRRLLPIPEDKLHRRNPHTVRQEIKMFDTPISDTTLADVNLSEMPGLHNTEQWKRIAGRAVHASPPLSRQYYQTVVSTLESQNGQVPQPLGSYRRPGRSENEEERPITSASPWRAPRRRIFFGSSIAVVVVAIVVAVVLAITLIQKTGQSTTNYYSGSVYVNAKFDQVLSDPTSSLARSYKKDFCTLIGTTLADSKTKYALYFSTCTVVDFRNGSIIADFILGFTHFQNATRLNSFLNRSLVNKSLFGGTILSIVLNTTTVYQPISSNYTNTTGNSTDYDYSGDSSAYDDNDYSTENDDDHDDASNSGKSIMTEQNQTNDQTESARTTYTTVTYTKLDTGLSITISETITITNNNSNTLEKSSINNKNYELILVPSIENTKTVVIPTGDNKNEKSLLSSTAAVVTPTTNVLTKSPSQQNLLQSIKPNKDSNFAYIDESCDERTFSSGDGISTLEDLTTHDSSTASTISLNDETLLDSASTLVDDFTQSKKEVTSRPSKPPNRSPPKDTTDSNEMKPPLPPRPIVNTGKRQRRMIIPKNQRRLLQYELMPTGKVYYVDRPFHNEKKTVIKDDTDENSSVVLSTILSRSSSLDTLSDKHYRHRHRHHQQQQNRRIYQDSTLKKPEQKLSVGGRLASSNNLPTSSPFKPIITQKKKRFSSFEPTPESLDQVFDVLIAADKRREEHEFWREKFDQRQPSTRVPLVTGRIHETMNSNTIPSFRSKPTQGTSNSTLNNPDNRSQSHTTKRNSFNPSNQQQQKQQSGCLLEDCLQKRKFILQQQTQRNYSPNIIYSTNYPKQQLLPIGKLPVPTPPTTSTTNQPPIRILPLPNGRIGRAPQARQTSDELSTVSDVWATRSSFEDESQHPKKSSNHARFQSTVNRHRLIDQKPNPTKRATSVEQQKTNQIQTKTPASSKNKFFDLFKFNR